MTKKVILITGSTDGIGEQTALQLARSGNTILLQGRNKAKAEKTQKTIIAETGNKNVSYFTADFSRLTEVQGLAGSVKQNYEQLHVLINNAGVYATKKEITIDGFETTFQVNHLAPFLLTLLLLQQIVKGAPSRIINVSSAAHFQGRIDFNNLQGEKYFDPYSAYASSKLANILFTAELSERLKGTGTTVNALHPGVVNTKLLRAGFSRMGLSPEKGSETPVYLALSDEVEYISGKYFDKKKQISFSKIADDPVIRKRFWDISEKMVVKYLTG